MTIRDSRLLRLSGGLTANERALLVLRSWKDEREEDPSWRRSMPDEQAPEFYRLIELMTGVNDRLLPLLLVVGLEVDKLQLRLGQLALLMLWNHQALEVDAYLRYGTKARNGHTAQLEGSLEHAPLRPVVYLSEDLRELVAKEERAPTKLDELADDLKDMLREGIAAQTGFLGAAEAVVAEVAEDFAGEDPALPHVREIMDGVAAQLADVRAGAERYTGPLVEAERDEAIVDKVRALVENRRP